MASGFSTHMLNVGAVAMAGEVTHVQLHSADPGAAGTTNVVSGVSRVAGTVTASGADIALDATVSFTGGTGGATAAWVSLWDASTAGNWLGNFQITSGDTTLNAEGDLDVTAIAISGS